MNFKSPLSISIIFCVTLSSLQANAAISLDRTRIIFPGDQKSISMTISNENKQLPYLAQGWIENDKGEKINSPFVVLPPVQRVEPGSKTQIKIQGTNGFTALPQDRESVFYFNLREIPPRSNKPNVLQLALQTKVKLFYRPQSLLQSSDAKPWQESMTLIRSGDRYLVHNPTGYYATIIDAREKGAKSENKFKPIMVSPRSDVDLGLSATELGSTPELVYINDFGGRPILSFSCSGTNCKVTSTKTSD